jgi:hypothetical protein
MPALCPWWAGDGKNHAAGRGKGNDGDALLGLGPTEVYYKPVFNYTA